MAAELDLVAENIAAHQVCRAFMRPCGRFHGAGAYAAADHRSAQPYDRRDSARPDIKAAWEKQGATPLVMSRAEFENFMAAEVVKWAKVIKDNRIATIQ